MARTTEEVQSSLVTTIQNTDPSIDVAKGPVYDFVISPVAPEISTLEQQVDRLAKLVTEKFPDAATQEEIDAILNCFGLAEAGGKASTGTFLFWAYARPTQDVPIKRGVLVSTANGTYTFFVNSDRTMYFDSIDTYYNASTRRYEISAPITAIAIGPQFDLPRYRINKITTGIDEIDGGWNTTETTGGTSKESAEHAVDRARAAFQGLNSDAGGSVLSSIFKYDPDDVLDVQLVYPKDRDIFVRYTTRPAIDAYVLGTNYVDQVQSFTSVSGQTEITLDKPPAFSVSQVTIDGTISNDWVFVKDLSASLGGTTSAVDKVYFTMTGGLLAGKVVEIIYQYNALITGLQEDVFSDTRMFDTDIWAREPFRVRIGCYMSCKILSSFDEINATQDIESEARFYLAPTRFGQFYYPKNLQQDIQDNVSAVAGNGCTITKFTRLDTGTLDVQVIELKKNEILDLDNSDFNVKVQKT